MKRRRAPFKLLLISLILVITGAANRGMGATAPVAPPEANAPGRLVRAEPFTQSMPAAATAKRVLYTTTALDGTIREASGLVYLPDAVPPAGGFPVILWAHGTTGFAPRCAPSLMEDPLEAGSMPAVDEVLANEWAIVAPDYPGLGTAGPHPYLIGAPEAWSLLDAARAARQIDGIELSDQTVVWGYSQGGGAALWTGIEAETYAPDVPLLGIAAMAPASDLVALGLALDADPIGQLIGTFIISAYSTVYPDVAFDDYVRADARETVREIAGRCLGGSETVRSIAEISFGGPLFSRTASDGALGLRLAENTPSRVTGIPTLIGQGQNDTLVLPNVQAAFVEQLCDDGQSIAYRTYAGRDHLSLLDADSSAVTDLLDWTVDRFAGVAPDSGCSTVKR